MANQHEAQPQDRCCLGGYCWRKCCPNKAHMRRWMMQQAVRRDRLAGAALNEQEIEELQDEDRLEHPLG